MTAFAARTRPGPPTNGRYQLGDSIPDSNGVYWICSKGGMAGANTFDSDGAQFIAASTSPGLNQLGIGAPNGATVSASEAGDGVVHKTILTLTATPVTVTDEAGISQWGGTAKVYDFPAGHICILGAMVDGSLTLGVTGTIINTYASVWSLGSVAASATGAQTLVTTAADILKQFAGATAVAKVAAVKGGPVATQITEAGALWYDGHTTALDMYLNVKVADDVTHTSGTGTFTGTIAVHWINLGDN